MFLRWIFQVLQRTAQPLNVEKHVEHAAGDECEAERCRRCHTFTEGLQLNRATQLSPLCHAVPCCAMLCHAGAIRMESPVSWSPVESRGVLWSAVALSWARDSRSWGNPQRTHSYLETDHREGRQLERQGTLNRHILQTSLDFRYRLQLIPERIQVSMHLHCLFLEIPW